MISRILKDGAYYTVPVLTARALNFLLLPVYTRILTPGMYGALDLMFVFGGFVNLVLPLEISQGVARYTATAATSERKSVYAATAFRFAVACYLPFVLVFLWLAPVAARVLLDDAELAGVFRLAVVTIALNGLHALLLNQLKWELRSRAYAANHLLVAVGSALASFVFAYVFKLGLAGILYGMILGFAIGLIVGAWQLRDRVLGRFERRALAEMLAYSAPLAVSGIGVFVNTYVDRLMLNHFLSLESVGLYGMAVRIASIASLATVGIQSALSPIIFSQHETSETRTELARLFRLFVGGALLLTLTLGLFAREILQLVATPQYFGAAPVVIWLTAALLLASMYVFTPGLSLAKKTFHILWINLGGAALNLLLNLVLIPRLGMTGAAIATLTASAAVFSAYLFLSQRIYAVPHLWLKLFLGAAIMASFAAAVLQVAGSGFELIAIKAAIVVAAFLLFVGIGLIRREEIGAALRRLRRQP